MNPFLFQKKKDDLFVDLFADISWSDGEGDIEESDELKRIDEKDNDRIVEDNRIKAQGSNRIADDHGKEEYELDAWEGNDDEEEDEEV